MIRILPLVCLTTVSFWSGSAQAATYSWTGPGTTWDTTATNWSGGGTDPWNLANGSGNEASIGNAGTINVSGNVYAGEILFTGGTTIINDGGSGTITLYSSTRGI